MECGKQTARHVTSTDLPLIMTLRSSITIIPRALEFHRTALASRLPGSVTYWHSCEPQFYLSGGRELRVA